MKRDHTSIIPQLILLSLFLITPTFFTAAVMAASGNYPHYSSKSEAASRKSVTPLLVPEDAILSDSFSTDPRADGHWTFRGTWSWKSATGVLASSSRGTNTGIWNQPILFTGRIGARIKLFPTLTTAPPRARLIFAKRNDGCYRYVTLIAGSPGKIIVGQKGIIEGRPAGKIKAARINLPAKRWQNVSVEIPGEGGLKVFLGSNLVLNHATLRPAEGQIGLSSLSTKVFFDDIYISQPCRDCHGGQSDHTPAPDVLTYWDGSWWDSNYSGSPIIQQGGHGDEGDYPAISCAGVNGCHDLRQSPLTHLNGVAEGRGNTTLNTYHLRSGFINASPTNPWDVQVTFDQFCFNACHNELGIGLGSSGPHNHDNDGFPAAWAVMLGTHSSVESIPYPVDSDLTSLAGMESPVFAPCVSCHNPHGTGVQDTAGSSNRMLRDRWIQNSDLCVTCHY